MSDVTTLAQQLLALPSITPHDAGCQLLIREKLEALGFTVESMRFGEVDNLWARYGKSSPLLVFAGHTDVVPTGPMEQWTSPPFEPAIRDEYLYGRGAVDMKASIAAMITATENFLKSHPDFSGSIGFLLTSDEEGPAIDGTAKVIEILKKRNEKMDYCIIGEPSSDKKAGDQIRVGRRGSLTGKLIIHGIQGHVAAPHLAANPIHLSSPALHELATTEWDKGNEFYPPTTFQISNIHAGTGAANVIPGDVEIVFNFRYGTAVTIEELQKRVETILNKYNLKFAINWHNGAKPFLTKKGKLISATVDAIKSKTGMTTILSTAGGTSDGRFIAPTGTEVVELGVSNATAHHINECVRVEDLKMLEKIYQEILNKIFV